ncbi:MAG: efflux RND transporter periplasmic adaptor subunit [Ignavibacteriales bacterium]|nr:efflux RND transporter periplasmic adaptor subunit [Ignavibacteriales bacterium]
MRNLLLFLVLLLLSGCSNKNGENISASGTIETKEVTVSAKVGGQVVRIFADEGKNVQAGDTLLLIDQSDLEIQFDQAKANADAADAQYKLAVQGARQEDIAQAEATLENANADLKRNEQLFKEGSIAQKQLDDTRTRYILAKQTYDKVRKGSRPEEIDAARARLAQANAQVRAIKKKIDDSYVTAPFTGVITQKSIEEGEMIMPNSSLLRISQLQQVYLNIYISEVELARVKLGQEAKVYIDGEPAKSFPGKVTYISSIAEFTPKNVQTKEDRTKLVFGVKIEIQNPDGILKPGIPADAIIVKAVPAGGS